MNLPLFGAVPLDDAQVIGTWADGGEGGIRTGWVRGFVSDETAMATTIQGEVPSHLALFDIQTGATLEIFLPEAQEAGPGGASGWWFLAELSAKPARFEMAE